MKVAVLGAGLMGRPMAERLKAAGHTVVVHNRTKAKVADLPGFGVAVADRPEDAVRQADCVILMLADASAIRDTLLTGAARTVLRGRTVIQMGTIGPRDSRALQREVDAAGAEYFEAPVLGSIAEAKAGTLFIMVGGAREQIARWHDVLRTLGREPRLIGPVGLAAALKLALNQLIAAEIAAFSLSLGLVQREGIPVEAFMAVLRDSHLFAPVFEKKLPRLLQRNYGTPNFSTRHLLKDVELFLAEAGPLGLATEGLEAVRPLLQKTIAAGLGDEDYSAVFNAIAPPP